MEENPSPIIRIREMMRIIKMEMLLRNPYLEIPVCPG